MKFILFANTDWYLYNFRLSLAKAIRDAGHDLLLISPDGEYGPKLRSLGFRWEPVPMVRKSLNPLHEVRLLFYLWALFRRERATLVHGFTIKCAVYGALAARFASVPMRISAVAGMGFVFTSNSIKARLLRPVVKLLMRFSLGGEAARLILQNSDDVNLFEEHGLIRAEQIRLIRGSGVDCQRFIASRARYERQLPSRVLLAGRLLWDKGIAEYVAAARLLRSEGRSDIFLLAGDPDFGNPTAISETEIATWVEEGVIEWLGHVDDMASLLGTVDIVTLPSYREGLPKTLIEAAACELPLVTTDVPGCREVVTDSVDGLLVPVRNPIALADAIRRLLDDAAFAQKLGMAARRKALVEFDEKIVIERTLSVYNEVLLGNSSNS